MIQQYEKDRRTNSEKKEERVIIETYSEELIRVTSNPAMIFVHKFGERQNAYNRNMEARMQAVQSVCRRFQGEINTLKEENDSLRAELEMEKKMNRELFERMANDMKVMQKVLNELRLHTKLNSNTSTLNTREIEAIKERLDVLENAPAEDIAETEE